MPTSFDHGRAAARFVITMLLASSRGLAAQDAVTQAVGGDSGDPYTVTCGTKAMVGIIGRWAFHVFSTFVDKIQPICVSVDADGAWIGTPSPTSNYAGVANSQNSASVSVICPARMAISGFEAQSGIYVDRFWIYCQLMGQGGHLLFGQSSQQQTPIGGEYQLGPAFHGPFMCPSDKPGKGITGKAHDWIDRLALVCNHPSVPPPSIASLDLNPPAVVGGSQVTGSFELNAPALSGGASVNFSVQVLAADASKVPSGPISPNPSIVPAGQTHGSFLFNTVPVATTVGVTINSGSPTAMVSRSFSILPPSLSSLTISPSRVAPGSIPMGTISLTGSAPAGVSVTLASSVPSAATVPATVVVPQGQASTAFPVTVSASRSACTVVTASGVFTPPGSPPQKQLALAISASTNKAFSLSMPTQAGGATTGTIALAAAAKEPRVLTISSTNSALVTAPASITIGAGAASADFPITIQGTPPAGTSCAVITATDRDGNANALVLEIIGQTMRRIG
jgi:hypothetical protein